MFALLTGMGDYFSMLSSVFQSFIWKSTDGFNLRYSLGFLESFGIIMKTAMKIVEFSWLVVEMRGHSTKFIRRINPLKFQICLAHAIYDSSVYSDVIDVFRSFDIGQFFSASFSKTENFESSIPFTLAFTVR